MDKTPVIYMPIQIGKKGMIMMKKKQWIGGFLLLVCLMLTACGSKKETTEVTETIEATETVSQEKSTAEVPTFSQERYQELAKENIQLFEQLKYLTIRNSYFENLAVSKTADGFSNPDLMEDVENRNDAAVEPREATENPVSGNLAQEMSIKEIDDSQLESKITKLEEENQLLNEKIAMLQKQIEVYQLQYR